MGQRSPRRIRYAVVGAGNIVQVAVLPGFQNARENSELVAIVSSDAEKRRALQQLYGVEHTGDYDGFERILDRACVEAVFIGLPNSQHRAFTERAARAHVHVLCEKPMATTVEDCEAMMRACVDGGVKLMIAYRLHFEEANLSAIEIVRSGRLGQPRLLSATLTQQVRPGDIRTRRDVGGGALWDAGPYPVNAARYLFRQEPIEVMAFTGSDPRFEGVDASAVGMLRFPGGQLAQFIVSQAAAPTSGYRIIGTEGDLRVDPGFDYAGARRQVITVGDSIEQRAYAPRDQFGPEIVYFSRCILEDLEPEPSGLEGLADVRVLQALYESARTGRAVSLPPFEKAVRPGPDQLISMLPQPRPATVKAPDPTVE